MDIPSYFTIRLKLTRRALDARQASVETRALCAGARGLILIGRHTVPDIAPVVPRTRLNVG